MTVLLIYISLTIIIPFIFTGSTAPFFVIHNDDRKSHEAAVEVFDQNNKSVINETYSLEPKSDFSQSRPLSLKLSWEKKEYIFKVTMDKKITNMTKVEIPNRRTSVYIRLYYKNHGDIPHMDYESPKIIPIFIQTVERMC
ncbi:hypothetical protein MCM1_1316 [Methanosarcina barkeri CM1]|uniref:Uncharacterized protein n=2 Tax=Methanosarcina barkeri TaxID=2208 RepID=A0A0G3CEJ7_METBA|nr:hypothetical protein MCM1_1316 [Methanosarcina barkeri CM1]